MLPWGSAGRGRWLWPAIGIIVLSVGGCRSPVATGSPLPTAAVAASTVVATAVNGRPTSDSTSPTASAPSPTIRPTATAATAPTADAPPTPTPQPTTTATRDAGGRASSTPTASPAPPTFTPPPPPPPVEGEHLFWQRPVPAAGPTWTDKAYPYGSTRGGSLRPHHGVEFVVPPGTPVLAVAPATVRVAGDDSQTAYGPQTNFYGNLVVLEMADTSGVPIFALYGHLSEVTVEVGQVVAAGDVLGLSGSSGVADGPHLHLEARVGENSYSATRNPLLWLKPLPGTGVVAGRVVGPGGALLHEAPVALQRVDGLAPYTATASYAADGPNPDGRLAENFVMDDVEPGFYELVVTDGRQRHTVELWVFPGRVNWVEIVVP